MVTVLRTLTALLLFAGIMVCGEVAWTIQKIRPELEVTISNVDRATIAAGAAAANVEKASRAWQQSSEKQASQVTQAMSNVSAAAAGFSIFASNLDASVNSKLLASLTSAIQEQNAGLLDAERGLQADLSQMAQATAAAQKVLADADVQISNPSIQKSVDSLATTSQNLAVTTEQAAATMKDVRSAVDYEVHELTKPVSKIKTAFLFVIKAAGLFFGY